MSFSCNGDRSSKAPSEAFIEGGAPGASFCNASDDVSRALCDAIFDDATPGVVDAGEYDDLVRDLGEDAARKAGELVLEPPLFERIELLDDAAGEWCLLGSCKERRADAAREFHSYATRFALLHTLPRKRLEEMLSAAREMADGGKNEKIKGYGREAAAALEGALANFSSDAGGLYRPAFAGATVYVGAQFSLEAVPGMETLVKYWGKLYGEPQSTDVIARKTSKEDLLLVDRLPLMNADRSAGKSKATVSANRDKETKKALEGMNAKIGCKPIYREKKDTVWKCRSPDTDPFVSLKGQKEGTEKAVHLYRRFQPYIESSFLEEGMAPFLGTIAINESHMNPDAVSPDGAVGTYQFMPEVTNLKEFDLWSDEVVGIDERKHPILASKAAAKHMKDAYLQITKKNFVKGLSFDRDLAMVMTTPAFNAGWPMLRSALRSAKADLEKKLASGAKDKKPPPVTGEMVFSHLVGSKKSFGSFKAKSREYPQKLPPVVEAVYGGGIEGLEALPEVPDLAMFAISGFSKKTGVADIARMANMSVEEFSELNTHFDIAKTKSSISKGSLPTIRFFVPRADAARLRQRLLDGGHVEEGSVAVSQPMKAQGLYYGMAADELSKMKLVKDATPGLPDFVTTKRRPADE